MYVRVTTKYGIAFVKHPVERAPLISIPKKNSNAGLVKAKSQNSAGVLVADTPGTLGVIFF